MKAAHIDQKLLMQVHQVLHEAGRVDLANRLLSAVSLVQLEHTENLICPVHAAKLRCCSRPKIYTHAARGNLRIFRVCCRSFVSRQELQDLPKVGHKPRGLKSR